MAEESQSHNIPMYLVIAALGTGGSHVATRMSVEPEIINSATVQECIEITDYFVHLCKLECRLERLEIKLK